MKRISLIISTCPQCPHFSNHHMNVETPTCMFGKGQGHFRELPRGELQIDQINGIPFYEATGVIPNWCPLENV